MPPVIADESRLKLRREFTARAHDRSSEGVELRYVVGGGMPGDRLEMKIVVDPVNGARIEGHDQRVTAEAIETRVSPRDLDVPALFEQVAAGLHSLMPAADKRFVPDALIGKLTIVVDGQAETFYFVPETEKRRAQERPLAPMMDDALSRLWDIGTRAIANAERPKSA